MNILHLLSGLFYWRGGVLLKTIVLQIITIFCSFQLAFASNIESFSSPQRPLVGEPKQILILFSYHRAEWSDNVQKGIESVFAPFKNVSFFYEYMDTKRLKTKDYLETLRKIYIEKYHETNIDLIISVDNNALDLLTVNARALFPKTPVVFCGVNDYEPDMHATRPDVTGVVEYGGFSDTLKIAFKARPKATKLYVICDHTFTGEKNTEDLLSALSDVSPETQPVLTDRMSFEELSNTLQEAATQQVAFFVSFWKDGTGQNIEPSLLEVAFRKSAIPVFGRSEWMINHGMVGGKCVTGVAQGSAAARIALQVLGGTPVSELPVDRNSPNQYLFDYLMMKHYHIDKDVFPAESIGFNLPEPFYRISKPVGTTVLFLSVLLLVALVFLAVNIHQRRRALFALSQSNASLEQSESRYRGMIENIQDAFYRTDAAGILIFISPSGAQVLGYQSPQEMIGCPMASLWYFPAERLKMIEILNKDLVVHDYEIVLLRKDGSSVPVATTSGYYHDKDGKICGIEGVFRDITERKQAEDEREKLELQSRQLQKVKSLGRMAAAIAHHFNNKLFVVLANLEFALSNLPQNHATVNALTAAMEAAGKAADVSKSMLTYLGQATGPREPLNLSEICIRSLPLIQATIPQNVILKTSLLSSGTTITANSNQIQVILTNLINNSREAVGDDDGIIKVNVKTVYSSDIPAFFRFPIDWQPETNYYACLEVGDTGCGIAAKEIEEIFDPFFSKKFTGRGLGLPVVQGLVQAHHGAVTVESAPGQGSVFRVFFPISTVDICFQPEEGGKTPQIQMVGTVLLVDDDEIVLDISRTMLTTLGFDVLSASSGREAVEIFQQNTNSIRFVLTDFAMPHLNGLETMAALRQITPDVPVILASGYSEEQVMNNTCLESPQAFLGKPYGLQALKDTIIRILTNKRV